MNINSSLLKRFRQIFKADPHVISMASGRVELIGGHTDYNQGFVIACAINKKCKIAARRRNDKKIIIYSDWADDFFEFKLSSHLKLLSRPDWANYCLGVAALLAEVDNLPISGAELLIAGNIPVGAGLSSSAALEVATANALLALANSSEKKINKIKLARLCQKAENKYAHNPCGIMDQMTVLTGQKNLALLLDCRQLTVEKLPFDTENFCIMIFDSMIRHQLSISGYSDRKKQCQAALKIIQKKRPELLALRDVNTEVLTDLRKSLGSVLFKRAAHVVSENQRVLVAADALRNNDMKKFGVLMLDSHNSAKDLYEISCPQVDFLVRIAVDSGALGARLCGGSFGGAVVAVAQNKLADKIKQGVFAGYKKRFGIESRIYIVKPSDGIKIVRL